MTDQVPRIVRIFDQGAIYLFSIGGDLDTPLHELAAQGLVKIIKEIGNGSDDRNGQKREETP